LQDGCQGELGRRYRRVTEPAVTVSCAELFLETFVEDLVAMLAQEHEQLGSLHAPHYRRFGR
jgi:hypothetical protein